MLELDAVRCGYGPVNVVSDISLTLKPGLISCLVGPSGCGKTTMLRCIAGFEPVSAGTVVINGTVVSAPGIHVAPEHRRIGMVFQDYALFPHLTVRDNIGFGVPAGTAAKTRIDNLLDATELGAFAGRYPHQLSGGQQQRVAIARALAPSPHLLLLDEPFSNLDPSLREKMKREVARLLKDFQVTAVIVTHNQDEAFDIADEMGVIAGGVLQQWGHPYELYHHPTNRTVAEFLGISSFLPLTGAGEGYVQTSLGRVAVNKPVAAKWEETCLLLRPDDVVHDDDSPVTGIVTQVAFRGMYRIYDVQLEHGLIVHCFTSSHHELHQRGSRIGLRLDVRHPVLLAR